MFRLRYHRAGHYLLLLLTSALLTLPHLGRPSLWDVDEGVNAEASREMLESGNYVVPKFNFQLRDAKPALLYWCQVAAFRAFGVSEFSARLPSAIAIAVAVLLLYELGRAMFNPLAGLLAGIVLAGSGLVCALAHFANPDALLLACTVLTFLAFWIGYSGGRHGNWFVPVGVACGLGMLAKGPVALALPGAVIFLFLLWQRQLRRLWDRRYLQGVAAFLLIAAPWFILVTVETRGEFARGFFLRNNLGRYLEPMENHRGQVWYYLAVLPLGLAPWSVFLLPVIGATVRGLRQREDTPPNAVAAVRLLVCWVVVYLAFFTFSATKLPNYVAPLFPAAAVLVARFLDGWRRGEIRANVWLMRGGFSALFAIGIGTLIGLLLVGGAWRVPGYTGPVFAGVGRWAWIGLIPVVGSIVSAVAARRRSFSTVVGVTCAACVTFVAALLALPIADVDGYMAVRGLVAEAGTCRPDREIRLASYQYSQPSLVYYNQREVTPLLTEEQVAAFLAHPLPAYLFVPEPVWQAVEDCRPDLRHRPVARKWDLHRRCDVVVISNQ